MKKLIVCLLSLILILSLIGCGPGNNDATDDNGGKDAQGTDTKAEKVLVWAWDQNLPVIDYAKTKYKELYPNVNAEVVVQSVPDTVDKLSVFFSSGVGTDLPDLVLMGNDQIQAFLQQFPDKFVNLSKLGFDEYETSFSKAHWELLSYEGSIYAFPFDIAPLMMQMNTEILEAAGVDPQSLKTWEDVIAAAQAINGAGYAVQAQFENREVFALLQSAGVGIYDKAGNIDLLNPKVVEAIDMFIRLQKAKVSDKTASASGVGEGTVTMAIKPAWAVGEDMPVLTKIEGKVKLYPLPKIKDEKGYTSSANDGGSSFFILETSKVKDIAYEIGKIITTDLEAQDIALAEGLMPGYLPASELDSFNNEVPYYQGQKIWALLNESAIDTLPVYINEHHSIGKDIFANTIIHPIASGTDKTAEVLLKEAADLLASQTGRTVNEY